MKMDEFKLCSDGEFMPVSFPCPPPYSGPYYYYPYENIPLPPADQGDTTNYGSPPTSKGGAPISSGVVATIIIIVSALFVIMCFIGLKFRRRFILAGNIVRVSSRNSRHAGDQSQYVNSGDHMLVNISGCGLEEKLVNLLPVCEYVGLMQEGKVDGKERHECAVCLNLFEEKEIVRVLPKCKHTFHLQCIDKWFESHANCPLCRERITLQTIQLSFNSDSHNDQQPLGPVTHQDLTLNNQNNADFSHPHLHDQHLNSPPLCIHNVHDQRDGRSLQDLGPHQNIFLAGAASATDINNTPTAEPYQDQHADHPVSHAAGGHLFNDQNAAGFICRLQGLSDQNTLPIPVVTAESMKYKHGAESREDDNASNEAAKNAYAHCIDVGQFGGLKTLYDHPNPFALNDQSSQHGAADDQAVQSQIECNKIGGFLNPNKSSQQTHEIDNDDHKRAHEVDIDDHKSSLTSSLAEKFLYPNYDVDITQHNSQNILLMSMISSPHPTTRAFKVLRKCLSTGSINIEGDAKASHPYYEML